MNPLPLPFSPVRSRASISGRESGLTFIELSVGLGIIAILAVFLVPRMTDLFDKSKLELANQELVTVIAAVQQYRSQNGDYTGLTLKVLLDNGYYPGPYSGATPGTGQNTYGEDIAVTAVSSNADAQITYTFATAVGCAQMLDRLDGLQPIKGTPTCTNTPATLLTLVIE